jgi:hypothetical protein
MRANGGTVDGPDRSRNFVYSVVKAFAVLQAFDASLPELTITEIANRAGLDFA